jgi:hypothetical protein
MELKYILEQFASDINDRFEYREEDIREAIISEKPYLELKKIFTSEFWPKLERWLNSELKNIKVTEEETNRPGGELKAKLEKYLEVNTDSYEENVGILAREIINSYEKWDKKEIKDMNFPKSRFKKN